MADHNPTLLHEVLHITQRQREEDVQHHRQADDLWARLEVEERRALGQPERLRRRPARLKPVCSDKAPRRAKD